MLKLVGAAALLIAATAAPVAALPILSPAAPGVVSEAQYAHWKARDFRRCMRSKYGPRYFSGVKKRHRYFMAQACGG
jgi:hypothetical protein